MFREQIQEFFHELGSILKKIFTSRTIPFVAVAIVLFVILIHRLFVLQIVNGNNFKEDYSFKMQRTIYTTGTRGNIYDCNGELLAYSELSYNVIISDSGYYSSTKQRNASLNRILSQTIDIIEEHGDSVDYNFHIQLDNQGRYYYDVEDNALLRFLRDIYGHASISELTETERSATAEDTVNYLADYYGLDTKQYGRHKVLEILYIRYNLSSNLYQRYVNFTIARNISQDTMASILENEPDLGGVAIEEGSIRYYNYSICMAHIIGYTGKVSESELDELRLINESYDMNDVVGKSGIEKEYETTLAGTKGYKKVLVDNVGRIQKVIEEVEPQIGQDVYLTIDAVFQQEVYDLIERRLGEILYSSIVNSESTYDELNLISTIPIKEVYNALISNGLVSMEGIATSNTSTATYVYQLFVDRKAVVLSDLHTEFDKRTPYGSLSKNMKSYTKKMRTLLIANRIINEDKLDALDPLTEAWADGEISLLDYIEGAIQNDWINIYNLDVPSDYPSYSEVLDAIIEEAFREIENDKDFDKLIYEDLILNHKISGKNVVMLLMEQNKIAYTESEYVSISNGASTFDYLRNKILACEITAAQLALDPCSGAVVVENPNNGRLAAMVTYPSYDINYFSGTINADYYASLLEDKSSPLINRATQTKLAPGSTIKPLMTVAGFAEGVINERTVINCDGIFDKIVPNIKCHVYPYTHGDDNVYKALVDSCNDYFCDVGYRLGCLQNGVFNHDVGLSYISYYADALGLGTKTGIQIPETTPHVSDFNACASSIGQGTHAFTAINLARYTSTLANHGTVYDTSIVLKTQYPDESEQVVVDPEVYKYTELDPHIWDVVDYGMNNVVNVLIPDYVKNIPCTLHGKSGTAQEDKNRPNHAIYIMYSKNSDKSPGVVVTSLIPYGNYAANSLVLDYYVMSNLYKLDLPSHMLNVNYTITEIE